MELNRAWAGGFDFNVSLIQTILFLVQFGVKIRAWQNCIFTGCDCDPSSPNPDSFCPNNQYCKECKCIKEGMIKSIRLKINTSQIYNKRYNVHYQCFLSGCDCDESLPNADRFCPRQQVPNYFCCLKYFS